MNLADYKGKYVVFFFYPKDFTFVCPTEIIAFSDRHKEFEALNTQVIACSCDSVESHLAWINKSRKSGGLGEMHIPVASDITKEIANQYGVLLENEGVALRGLFIINPKGVLEQITINNLPVGRSVDETLRLIQAFQFVEKYGEVCPANWKPGNPTIDVKHSNKFFGAGHTESEAEKKLQRSEKKVLMVDSADEFKNLLETADKLVVDFWKEGCQKCLMMAPYFAELSENYKDITFASIENHVQGIMQLLEKPVEALPQFRFFVKGKEVKEPITGFKKRPLKESLDKF